MSGSRQADLNASGTLRSLLERSWKDRIEWSDLVPDTMSLHRATSVADGWTQFTLVELDACALSWRSDQHEMKPASQAFPFSETRDDAHTWQVSLAKVDPQEVYIFNNHEIDMWSVAIKEPHQHAIASRWSGTQQVGTSAPNKFNFPPRAELRANLPIGSQRDANEVAILIQRLISSCRQR
jgi:hypothetical protein